MVAFSIGALLPLLTILLPSPERFWVTGVAVAVALAITGWASATLGRARPWPAVVRNVCGGVFAMAVTLLIGHLLGTRIS
jgi:VIT1/CCC1 family predicted Fe2+/Mn2+ transporter